ncbi:MAG: PRC-barrel domain-containing protein [Xanthobacteraceae bacterium]
MLKKLLITTAVSGLMLSPVLAQSSMSPSTPNASQAGSGSYNKQDTSRSDMSKSDMSKTSARATGSVNFISAQNPDQLLASNFEGTDVLDPNDEKIGEVSDILFTKGGKIDAYVIGVGGFLGVGAKEVALAPSAVQVISGQNKDDFKLKVSLTKDQLAQAPAFEQYEAKRVTTGSASGEGMAPNATAPGNNAPISR